MVILCCTVKILASAADLLLVFLLFVEQVGGTGGRGATQYMSSVLRLTINSVPNKLSLT
jgi:hypothetical protein